MKGLDPRVATADFMVACDVSNPLTGPEGASAVYGPQKGATPAQVAQLDAALGNFADVVSHDLNAKVQDVPGSGAAGGLGVEERPPVFNAADRPGRPLPPMGQCHFREIVLSDFRAVAR